MKTQKLIKVKKINIKTAAALEAAGYIICIVG